jgi:hypothetical protein
MMNRLRQTFIFMQNDLKRLWNWLRWKLGYEVRVPEDYPTVWAAYNACAEAGIKKGKFNERITIRVTGGHAEPVTSRYMVLCNTHLIFDGPNIEAENQGETHVPR